MIIDDFQDTKIEKKDLGTKDDCQIVGLMKLLTKNPLLK